MSSGAHRDGVQAPSQPLLRHHAHHVRQQAHHCRTHLQDDRQEAALHKEDEEEGEDLCKCEFSLAYGAKILLNNTYLHLKRGKRYGLCGPNGCGKSTLMRAISNGQVDGFPPPEELKTVYVEHDLDDSEVEMHVVDYLVKWFGEKEPEKGVTEDVVVAQLNEVGFPADLQVRRPAAAWLCSSNRICACLHMCSFSSR